MKHVKERIVDKTKAWERFRMALKETGDINVVNQTSDDEVMRDVMEAIRQVRKARRAR